MSYTTLKRGDKGDGVVHLQSQLNKTGSMLKVDGDFGPATEKGVKYVQDIAEQPITGIVESSLWNWIQLQPMPFKLLHTNGIAFIANEETGGLSYYEMVTQWPHYPGHSSGITIGAGYDLRYNSEKNFRKTWSQYLPISHIDELAKDIGKKGSKARVKKLKEKGIFIPFKSAWPAFIDHTLPRFYNSTISIYPSLNKLPDLCRSALVSLVFNRGASLSGSRRREMKNIQSILNMADNDSLTVIEQKEVLQGIEDEFLSMKRIWKNGSGLIKRRQAEANLWREGLSSWTN